MIEHKGARFAARMPKRHPCDVTADRLLDHLERYPEKFDGQARDDIGHVRFILQQIADGER